MLVHENSGRGLPYIPRPVREAGGTVHLLVIYNVKCIWVKETQGQGDRMGSGEANCDWLERLATERKVQGTTSARLIMFATAWRVKRMDATVGTVHVLAVTISGKQAQCPTGWRPASRGEMQCKVKSMDATVGTVHVLAVTISGKQAQCPTGW